MTETTGMHFRAQAFIGFIHPNWRGASLDPANAAFGKITGKTGDLHSLQLSPRFFFQEERRDPNNEPDFAQRGVRLFFGCVLARRRQRADAAVAIINARTRYSEGRIAR